MGRVSWAGDLVHAPATPVKQGTIFGDEEEVKEKPCTKIKKKEEKKKRTVRVYEGPPVKRSGKAIVWDWSGSE